MCCLPRVCSFSLELPILPLVFYLLLKAVLKQYWHSTQFPLHLLLFATIWQNIAFNSAAFDLYFRTAHSIGSFQTKKAAFE